MDPNTAINVYVKANTAPYIYAWSTEGSKTNMLNGVWPGKVMTDIENINGTDYYVFSVVDAEKFNIIFNNGNGAQTGNIEGITRDVYYMSMMVAQATNR